MPKDVLHIPDLAAAKDTTAFFIEMQNHLLLLEESLRDNEDSVGIIMGTLKAAGEFYQADRAYVMEVDRDLRIGVNTYEWCAEGITHEKEHLQHIPFEHVPLWENALHQNQPLIIEDVEELRDISPDEYAGMKCQNIHSLLATPYSKRINRGFLVVDNPHMYKEDPSFLLLLSYVIVLELNEIKLQASLDKAGRSVTQHSPTDIHINMFGGLEIISAQGILRDEDFKSDQGCNLLTYLIFSKGSIQPVHKLSEVNRLDADVEDPYNSVKGVVYRLRSVLSYIGLQDLVQATHGTFAINPKYVIHTDVERFDELCHKISQTNKIETLKGLYKTLMGLYKGSLLPWYDYFPWLMPKVSYYQNRYIDALKSYIQLLNQSQNYLEVHRIATEALTISFHDADFLFYSIMADIYLGNRNLAKLHYKQSSDYLSEEQRTIICQNL